MVHVFVLFVFSIIIYCVSSAPLIQTPSTSIVWSDFLGINVQFEWFNETTVKQQMLALKELNISWIRASCHWSILEPTENNFQWSIYDTAMDLIKDNNFKTILTFVGTPNFASSFTSGTPTTDSYPPKDDTLFADRVLKLNSRYPFVNYLEIWNEQNLAGLSAFWAPYYNSTRYNQLYQTTASIVRNAGYGNKLAVGGMGYYGISTDKDGNLVSMVDDLLALNGFEHSLVSYHPYTNLPEGGLDQNQYADSPYGHISTSKYINDKIRSGKANGVWSTEWGWSSSDQVDESTQSKYTIRRLLIDTLIGFDKTFLFTTSDLDARASSLRDQGYGIVDIGVDKKPVFKALSHLFNITGPSILNVSSSLIAQYLDPSTLGEDFVGVFYKKPSTNTTLFAFWSISQSLTFNLNVNETGLLYSFSNLSSKLINPNTASGSTSLSLSSDINIFEWPIRNDNHHSSSHQDSNGNSDSSVSFSVKLKSTLLFIFIINFITFNI